MFDFGCIGLYTLPAGTQWSGDVNKAKPDKDKQNNDEPPHCSGFVMIAWVFDRVIGKRDRCHPNAEVDFGVLCFTSIFRFPAIEHAAIQH